MGSFAVQAARATRFVVYAIASAGHHDNLEGLGVDAAFDYQAGDVVERIVERVRRDGVDLRIANCVVQGSPRPMLDVLRVTKGDTVAQVAYISGLLPGAPTLEGFEVRFNMPMGVGDRKEHMYRCFQVWLQNGLQSGTVVPGALI